VFTHRPQPLFPPRPPRRTHPAETFFTPFQNANGEWDMGKILKAIDQVNGIAKQIRPILSEWKK